MLRGYNISDAGGGYWLINLLIELAALHIATRINSSSKVKNVVAFGSMTCCPASYYY